MLGRIHSIDTFSTLDGQELERLFLCRVVALDASTATTPTPGVGKTPVPKTIRWRP